MKHPDILDIQKFEIFEKLYICKKVFLNQTPTEILLLRKAFVKPLFYLFFFTKYHSSQ